MSIQDYQGPLTHDHDLSALLANRIEDHVNAGLLGCAIYTGKHMHSIVEL